MSAVSKDSTNERSPLLSNNLQVSSSVNSSGVASPSAASNEVSSIVTPASVCSPTVNNNQEDAYTFHQTSKNHSNPVSPRHVVNDSQSNNEFLEPHDAEYPPEDIPDEQTALLSFPPAFRAQEAEDNHNIWDVLCHSIESLTASGTIGVIGAVIVLIFMISTLAHLIPLLTGTDDSAHNGDGTEPIGVGDESLFKNLADSFVTAIKQAAVPKLHNVDFYGIADGNVQIRLAADVSLNYTNVANKRIGWLLQGLTFPVGSISLRNMTADLFIRKENVSSLSVPEAIWVFGDFKSADGQYYKKALTVAIPEIRNIKLRHNQFTEIDLIANVSGFENPALLSGTIRKLIFGNSIFARVVTELRPHKGFISLGAYPVDVDAVVNPSNTGGSFDDLFGAMVKLTSLEIAPESSDEKDDVSSAINVAASVFLKDIIAFALGSLHLSTKELRYLPKDLFFALPQIQWEIDVPGCDYDEDKNDVLPITGMKTLPIDIHIGKPDNLSSYIDVLTKNQVEISALASVTQFSDELSIPCPNSNHSVLDSFIQQYLSGQKTHIILKGASPSDQNEAIPGVLASLLSEIHVPVPITGRKTHKHKKKLPPSDGGEVDDVDDVGKDLLLFSSKNEPPTQAHDGNDGVDEEEEALIKEITFSNLKITLPPPKSPFDRPGSPEVPPKVSAHIEVILHPPSVLNVTTDLGVTVGQVRGPGKLIDGNTGILFAKFNVSEWVDCETTTQPDLPSVVEYYNEDGGQPLPLLDYVVSFDLVQVPMTVVDQKVLSSVATQLLLKGEVPLGFDSVVDLGIESVIGDFTLNKIPVKGSTTMKQ